ncbi:MAG: SMP-30/gluconolactonase/LRE family protein, partial [Desulfatiglans sp.]|nr:SMP-30/gluconolactonase/LRE family protein [Desulfatiglans sp.]
HGASLEEEAVIAQFEDPPGGLNFHPDGRLMVCLDGKGLALVGKQGVEERLDIAGDGAIRCANTAVAAPDGRVYIADGTSYHGPREWYFDLMEKRTTGRLLRYDPETSKTETLLGGLSFPNGVAISHDGTSLLLTESWSHTLSRYPLSDIRPETRDVLISNLPGYPGRIVPASGGYWMTLFAMRTHLVEFVLTEDKYREEMMRSIDPAYWIRPALSSGEDFLEPLQAGHAKTLGVMKPWAPPRSYGLIARLDEDYEIRGSFHCRVNGKRHGITGVRERGGALYAASKGNSLILEGRSGGA